MTTHEVSWILLKNTEKKMKI